MTALLTAASICSSVSSVIALVLLFVKPIREKFLGTKDIREGQRCLLRADMLGTYYKNLDARKIRQYEKENFILEYQAYKALGGNSFIDDIAKKVRSWDVLT